MSAPNFYLRNANRYFVKETDECCIDESYEMDELSWLAEEHGFEICTNENWLRKIERKANNLRDYYATALHSYYECECRDQFDGTWRVGIVPLVRSGYYTGANLDFYITLRTEYGEDLHNEDVFNIDCLKDCVADYLYSLDNFAEGDGCKVLDVISELIEQATSKFYEFAEATGWDEYAMAWQCSNGEAGYTNLSEIKRKAGKE